jgi:hypothetical protein
VDRLWALGSALASRVRACRERWVNVEFRNPRRWRSPSIDAEVSTFLVHQRSGECPQRVPSVDADGCGDRSA